MKMKHWKNLICLLVMAAALTGCRSAGSAVNKVTSFGKALKTWSENKYNADSTLNANKYTVELATVDCNLMTNLARKYPIEDAEGKIETFNIEDYKMTLGKWFEDDENVLITLNDVKEPNKKELEQIEDYEAIKSQYIFIEGNLTVKNYKRDTIKHQEPYKELYYIRRRSSKITKISPRTYTDTGLIRLDFSDIDERESVGGSVNYSPNWPVSLSASYSYGYFMFGVDGGFNTDHDQVVQKKLTMQNILNYQKETISYDPQWYITATPSLYLKYLSVGCGAGIMYSKRNIDPLKKGKNRLYHISFMLRPTIKGYIPLNDEWFLTVNTSYDWAMDLKIKNGLSFDLGLQYRLN